MTRTLLLPALIACTLTLSACNNTPAEPTADTSTAAEAPAPAAPDEPGVVRDSDLPHDALPEVATGRDGWEECPYLESQWVADTNGQRMTGQGIDPRFDTPACVFWSYPEEPQATVIVRHMPDIDAANAVVDWAAPIDSTNPVELDTGWSGGRGTTPSGSVYAVYKNNVAVVVFSNQEQSVKAEGIALETINNLGL